MNKTSKSFNALNGRSGSSQVPYRDAASSVASMMGKNTSGGIEKMAGGCGCGGGRKK